MLHLRWLQKTNVAETTIANEFNPSPQPKQTLGKFFQVVLAVVMAVAMFVMPIQTVNATPMIEFTDSQQALGNSSSYGVSLADVDGDGNTDAFVANRGENKVWLNDGSGQFTDSQQALGNSNSADVSLADVDGDGDTDAFVANGGEPNKVWLNDGSGQFTDSQQALGNSSSYGVSLADVDGDGDTDAFVANLRQPNKVWLNDGSGQFTDSQQALGNSNSYGVSLADVDGDGDTDAFVTNFGEPNKVWSNDGSGQFTDSQQALGNSNSADVSLADVDGDGDTDAFVANNKSEPNKVWLNDGSGQFTDSQQALGHSSSVGVSLADVDGDGDTDAFVANLNEPNKVWLNNFDQYLPTNLTLNNTAPDLKDTFIYQLVSGEGDTDNSAFTIDGNQLKIKDSPDYETESNYSIRVQTTDSEGGTFQKTFSIKVNDLNDPPTNLTLSNTTIDENVPAKSLVGIFSTTDPDDNKLDSVQQ
ncbi:MAG: hypothetical protein F6K54_40230 [Okeania sp. SIO3B5]|uniref:FG-GAP-like repeat-containing protein n=1 Tax=Okeania sp. SIO3B5 TaxID=2607811 RepID=UPI0013FE5040|nr:FG-GAP-like repeat-containing protein [Okeania sp. SIO3B5]NEO58721.1 hypothetical protein [Okeania sp. SIO3B5]